MEDNDKTRAQLIQELQALRQRNAILESELAGQKEKEHSEFLRTLLDTIPNPVFYKDREGRYTGCNRAFEAFIGKPSEDIIGKSVYDMGPAAIADMYAQKDQELFQTPGTQRYEWQVQRCNGEIRDVIFHKASLLDRHGKVSGLVGVISDITERKQAEKSLRENEARFKAFMEHLPGATFIKDIQGKIVYCNTQFASMINTTPQQLIGVNTDAYLPVDIQRKYEQENRTVIEEETFLTSESVFPVHGQNTYWLSYKFPIRIEQEHLLGAISLDITDRKQAEEALQNNEAMFRKAQEVAHLGHWERDLETDQIWWSEETFRIFGLSPQEFEPRYEDILPHLHPQDRHLLETAIQEAIDTTQTYAVNYRIIRPNGDVRHIHSAGEAIYDPAGKPLRMFGIVQDITDRKQVEEALRESEKKYRMLFEHLPIPVFTKNGEGVYIDCNTENKRYWAVNPIGHTDAELLDEETAAALREADRRVLQSGETLTLEEHFAHTPLGARDVLTRKMPLRNSRGEIVGILGASLDISGRKQAEEALSLSEARLRQTIDLAPFQIFVRDLQGRYVVVNQAAAAHRGIPPQQMEGKHYSELPGQLAQEFPEYLRSDREAIMNGQQQFIPAQSFSRPGKVTHWFDIHKIPYPMPASEERAALVVAVDVTDRKRAEAALRESEEQFRTMFEETPVGIAFADMHSSRLTQVNPAFCHLFGYSEQELLEMTIADISYAEDMPENTRLFEQAVKQEFSDYRMEKRYLKKTGELIWANLIGTIVHDAQGNPTYRVGFLEDITERKQAQVDLQDALAEKEVLLQEVHHRVKNNLQMIHSLLYKQRQYVSDEIAKHALSESMNRVHAMALVHEQLYRSDHFASISLAHYLREFASHVFHTYKPRDQAIGLTLRLEDVPVSLELAIPIALALNELLTNALKYAFPEKRAGEMTIECREQQGEITLIVRDNGVGLPEDLDVRQTKTLGWYLVYNLVTKQLQGSVQIQRRNPTEVKMRFRKENIE